MVTFCKNAVYVPKVNPAGLVSMDGFSTLELLSSFHQRNRGLWIPCGIWWSTHQRVYVFVWFAGGKALFKE